MKKHLKVKYEITVRNTNGKESHHTINSFKIEDNLLMVRKGASITYINLKNVISFSILDKKKQKIIAEK